MKNSIEATIVNKLLPKRIAANKKFWLSTYAHFSNDLYNGFLSPLLPIIVVKMNISLTLAGFLVSIFAITSSLFQPVAGFFADRMERYYFILIGPLLAAIFMGFIGWTNHFWILVLILAVSGVGTSMFHPQGAALVGKVINHRKGFLMSIFNMAGSMGITVGSLIIIPLTSTFGLRATIYTVIPAIILFFISLRPILNEPIVHSKSQTSLNLIDTIKSHIFPLLFLYFMVVIRATIILTFAGFIPLFLTTQGQTTMFGGVALGVYQFFVTAGILLGGHLFDRFGPKLIFILSFIFIFPFAVGFINVPSVWGLPFLVIMGLFNAFSTSVNILLAQEIVPSKANFISAIMMGFGWGVAGILVIPIGALADHIGLYWTLTIVSFISIIGVILALIFPYSKIKK